MKGQRRQKKKHWITQVLVVVLVIPLAVICLGREREMKGVQINNCSRCAAKSATINYWTRQSTLRERKIGFEGSLSDFAHVICVKNCK